MALSIRNAGVEKKARDLAARRGKGMTEAIEEALDSSLEALALSASGLEAELRSIAAVSAAAPDLDRRGANEILGYSDEGSFGDGR